MPLIFFTSLTPQSGDAHWTSPPHMRKKARVLRSYCARTAATESLIAIANLTSTQQTSPQLSLVFNDYSKSQHISRPYRRDDLHNEDFFRFTRGRFVVDEKYNLAQRYVRFDVGELARLAAESVGAKFCINIEKYPDEMYNKVFLLTMDDGTQAVAKIPQPNAGRPHLTTASEVATMDFMRNKLMTPVPKVYAWSSRAQRNLIGAEYIIMEKLPGIRLSDVWANMVATDRLTIAGNIAAYQEVWMSVLFNQFGSLYYAEDLAGSTQSLSYTNYDGVAVTDHMFAVGPSTARTFYSDGRSNVEFDRGPWNSLEDYQSAIAHRELTCVRSVPRLPRSQFTLFGPGTYQPTREKKLKAVECYLAMIKYLLPTDPSIQYPCLWNNDLHIDNILVDPKNPTESTALAPLFEQARQPSFLDYDGPPAEGLEEPPKAKNFEQLDPEAQGKATELFQNQCVSVVYKTILHKDFPRLYLARAFQETISFKLLSLVQKGLADGEAIYLAIVVDLEEEWAELPGVVAHGGATAVPFPFRFSDEEKADIDADFNGALRGMKGMKAVKESMGQLFPDAWCVQSNYYDEACEALLQIKESAINMYATNEKEREIWRKNWPFDD